MTTSILNATKKSLGLAADYTPFDEELVVFVNGGLSYLHQLGIGPSEGFAITGASETWEQFLEKDENATESDPRLNSAITYMYLTVKLVFDPPASPVAAQSFKELREEAAWRVNVAREEIDHPLPPEPVSPILPDGGV